jgi:hypothetical protein
MPAFHIPTQPSSNAARREPRGFGVGSQLGSLSRRNILIQTVDKAEGIVSDPLTRAVAAFQGQADANPQLPADSPFKSVVATIVGRNTHL